MKIAILGAGAMGSLYGGPLSEKNDVWLVDVWKEHIDTINALGLKVKTADGEMVYHPMATTSAKDAGICELVIIFVKSVNTVEALAENKELFGDGTMVLTLQNGYGNDEDILPYVKAENMFIGTTACGATTLGPGHVFCAGVGPTNIGITKTGSPERVERIATVLNESGFETKVADDVMEAIWTKLLVNVGLNAPLALLNVRNGFMAECESVYQMGLMLVMEGVEVAKAEGYKLDGRAIAEHYYIDGAKVVGHNLCSMLQDVGKKRKTEVEKINGAIVKLGKKHGIPTPYNEAMLLMINAKECSYEFK
jgi:2-dehydropantoate 2-reductase